MAGLLLATDVRAAEWYLESELDQLLSYEDNIGLEDSGGEQVSGFSSTSSIGLTAGARTPVDDLSLTSLFNFTVFPTQSDLDSNDQYFTLKASHRGERWRAGLTGQYFRDTTRTSDVEDTGSFILANKRREFYSIGPDFSYRLLPTHEVSLSAYYNYNHYDTKEIPDSASMGVQAGWAHDLTERSQIFTNAYGSKINSNDTEEGNDNSRYYTLLIGVKHKFSENLQASLAAGPSFSETDIVETQEDGARHSESGFHTGYSFNAGLTYALEELIALEGDVFRALVASSSNGSLNEDTGVRVAASYQFHPDLFLDVPLTYVHRDTVGGQQLGGNEDTESRDYAAIEPTVRWRIAPDWEFRLGYGLQWEATDEGNGFGNSVFALLSYRLPRLAMSR
ncbi:MAG: transporter [Rhodospirillales bacterium]